MNHDMRVQVTKRMLKEGLLRCLVRQPLSRLTVSDLCRESGVNRATFYNHYSAPADVLREIAKDYAHQLDKTYYSSRVEQGQSGEMAVEACLTCLYEKREEIKILFSPNAENSISGFGLEIVNERMAGRSPLLRRSETGDPVDEYLYAVLTASAAFGLLRVWLTEDIRKTPREIMELLKHSLGEGYFS